MKKKYDGLFVLYVKDSSPCLQQFKSIKARQEFLSKFKTNHDDGNWIDLVIDGTVENIDMPFKGKK